jgi:hypothetical protein
MLIMSRERSEVGGPRRQKAVCFESTGDAQRSNFWPFVGMVTDVEDKHATRPTGAATANATVKAAIEHATRDSNDRYSWLIDVVVPGAILARRSRGKGRGYETERPARVATKIPGQSRGSEQQFGPPRDARRRPRLATSAGYGWPNFRCRRGVFSLAGELGFEP